MKVIIAAATPYVAVGNKCYLPPHELKSLLQWVDVFPRMTLLYPQWNTTPPEGWLEVPELFTMERLCAYRGTFLHRKRETLANAAALLGSADLLYARMPSYEAFWTWQASRSLGTPLLLELHGDWREAVEAEDATGLKRRITRRFRAVAADRAMSAMSRFAKMVLTVGPVLRDKYVPEATPVMVSTNHLTAESEFRSRQTIVTDQPLRMLFVGGLQRRKGLHVLFEALAILHQRGCRFHMQLAGSGPQQQALEAVAASRGFSDCVEFLGQVPHGEPLYALYRKADLFVLPSIASEGVPRVTHEAMAMGCPVVATDIGSVRWQLRGDAGITVEPGDADALVDAIASIIGNPGLRQSLSEKGFERAMEHTFEKQRAAITAFVRANLQGEKPVDAADS